MVLTLGQYSDLALELSQEAQASWEGEAAVRAKYHRYFTGEVFSEQVPLEAGSDEEAPELYPVGINLVKMLCTAQADATFGEWDEQIISFEPAQNETVEAPEKSAAELAATILSTSGANHLLWELALDREVYGGAPLKVSPALNLPGHIRWSRVPVDSFYPVWDPEDPDNLLEVYVVVELLREQAKARYGYDGAKDTILLVDHWTLQRHETTLGKQRIDAYSGVNPWGFVPYVYIPRFRASNWYGEALTEDLIRVQDELNMRIADLGEAINYNAHPVRYGFNLPKSFSAKAFPLDANAFWDLGRVIGQSPVPTVGMLEASNPLPQGTFDYIKFLYDWSQFSTFTPPVVLGQDTGGQRSGITLELRMQSLVRAIRRSRAYLSDGLKRAMRMSALILQQKDLPVGNWARARKRLIDGELTPHFAPIMPRDQASIVDEIQKGLFTSPPTVSLETAVRKLGYGTSEVERIKQMLSDRSLWVREDKALKLKQPKELDSGAGVAPHKEVEDGQKEAGQEEAG